MADIFSRRVARESSTFNHLSEKFKVRGVPGRGEHPLIAVTTAAAIFIIGSAIQTATQNKEMMMAGRFIGGIGIGGLVRATYLPKIADYKADRLQGVLVPCM